MERGLTKATLKAMHAEYLLKLDEKDSELGPYYEDCVMAIEDALYDIEQLEELREAMKEMTVM